MSVLLFVIALLLQECENYVGVVAGDKLRAVADREIDRRIVSDRRARPGLYSASVDIFKIALLIAENASAIGI